MGWTPKIVGGTDLEPKTNQNVSEDDIFVKASKRAASVELLPMGVLPPSNDNGATADEIEEITAEQLNHYAQEIPSYISVKWEYGRVETINYGGRKIEGQYVFEYRDGLLFKTFWVSG